MQRRLLLAVGSVAGLTAVGVTAVVVVPPILRDRISRQLDQLLADAIDADVEIGQMRISWLSDLPRVQVHLDEVVVTGRDPFAGIRLAALPEIDLGIDLGSLVFGEVLEIHHLAVAGPRLVLQTDAAGAHSFDVLSEAAADDDAPWVVRLDGIAVTDLQLTYDDHRNDIAMSVSGLDATGTGRLEGSRTRFDTTAGFRLTATRGGVPWLTDSVWDTSLKLDYDDGTYTLAGNRIRVNALTLQVDGTVHPDDDATTVDLRLSTPDTAFAAVLSVVPGAYVADYAALDVGGSLALSGGLSGPLGAGDGDLPAFDLQLTAADGRFRYPDLPDGVEDIALDVGITHPGGSADGIVVDLRRFGLSVGGDAIQGSMRATQLTRDPKIDLVARGHLDLAALARSVPQRPGWGGSVDLDLRIAGRASDFVTHQDHARATGTIVATSLRYPQPDGSVPITVDALDLTLFPDRAEVATMDLSWPGEGGRGDLSIAGPFEDFVAYFLTPKEFVGPTPVLQGRLSARGDHLDLRPFQESDPAADDGWSPVPADLDLVLDTEIAQLQTRTGRLSQLRGTVAFRDEALTIAGLTASALGGIIEVDGRYTVTAAGQADVTLQVEGEGLDVTQAIDQVALLETIAPVLRTSRGAFDGRVSATVGLAADGSPDLAALTSSGRFVARGITVRPAVLAATAGQLGAPRFRDLHLDGNVVSYDIDKGRLTVDPFRAEMGGITTEIAGRVGLGGGPLDLTLDLTLPTGGLEQAPALDPLRSVLPRRVDVRLAIGGTAAAPRPQVQLVGVDDRIAAAKSAAENRLAGFGGAIIEDLTATARRQGDALVAEAHRQAQLLREQADRTAATIRAEATRAGDALVAEAKGNPVKTALAKEASKVLVHEADQAADKVVAEANAAADTAIRQADRERDRLTQAAIEGRR